MRMSSILIGFIFGFLIHNEFAYSENITNSGEAEKQISMFLNDIITKNLKRNGWNNILFMGCLPESLYHSLQKLSFTFTITDTVTHEVHIENLVNYHSNIIIMNCTDFRDYEKGMKKILSLPYWHPLANIILYYQAPYDKEDIAKIFYIYWYYKSPNIIIIHNNGKTINISFYNPYMNENYKLDNLFTCQTTRKIGMPIGNYNKSFICSQKCGNITSYYSKIRAEYLGTCIGFNTETVHLKDWANIRNLNFFEDKGKNLHGFTFYAFAVHVLPFLDIKKHNNKTYTFHARDGMIWNTMAELLNFKIDISPSIETLKQPFDFEISIVQVFAFTQRKADLILFPLYQFDLIIAEIDYTVPFVDSGVCILSHRAGFQTVVFDVNLFEKNKYTIIELFICFMCTWFVFFVYNTEQIGYLSCDQAGKDLINTFRTVLSISLQNPPKRSSFRIFMTISIWSFFVINFSTQAAIISLFSVHKRDKEVDTFADIIKKGYNLEGMASPDVVFPDDDEESRIITSKIVPAHDLFDCINRMPKDSRRFCIIDCAVGRYLVKNLLDKKGKQFLHLASKARIHSHRLNMILHKNSPITEHFNKYILALLEAGLIKKWMDYRYFDRNDEGQVKSLGIEDLGGIFECYCFLVGITVIVFLLEMFLGFMLWTRHTFINYIRK